MPVREYVPTRPSEYHDLVGELAAEWKAPSQNPEPGRSSWSETGSAESFTFTSSGASGLASTGSCDRKP